MRRLHGLLLTGLGLAAAACGGASAPSGSGGQQATQGTQSSTTTAVIGAGAPAQQAGTWKLVAYYTAVESFHGGAPQAITGCPPGADECNRGMTPLGSFPADFVRVVKDEGTGRITTGPYAGKVLTWDTESGFSIDPVPGDANGNPLKPFAAAAADESVPLRTAFRVEDCGVDSSGGRIDGTICSRIMGASWTVVDRTTGKPSGSRELDLYIGDESHPDFQSSNPLDFSTVNARTTLR